MNSIKRLREDFSADNPFPKKQKMQDLFDVLPDDLAKMILKFASVSLVRLVSKRFAKLSADLTKENNKKVVLANVIGRTLLTDASPMMVDEQSAEESRDIEDEGEDKGYSIELKKLVITMSHSSQSEMKKNIGRALKEFKMDNIVCKLDPFSMNTYLISYIKDGQPVKHVKINEDDVLSSEEKEARKFFYQATRVNIIFDDWSF